MTGFQVMNKMLIRDFGINSDSGQKITEILKEGILRERRSILIRGRS